VYEDENKGGNRRVLRAQNQVIDGDKQGEAGEGSLNLYQRGGSTFASSDSNDFNILTEDKPSFNFLVLILSLLD